MLSAPRHGRRHQRRTAGPADWGIGMTVCIGAICDHGSAIVTASDRFVTWGTYSGSDVALKAARLAPKWITMIAGEDITRGVEDVIRDARATLSAYGNEPFGIAEVQAAVLGAWRDAQNRLATSMVLGPFGLTLQDFLKAGRSKFGDAKFSELTERIQIESLLKCQMLICGFDQNNIPGLFVCDDEIRCADFTRADFTAVGSGHPAATSSLAFHGYTRDVTLAEAVYQVCAAKFMAEKSLGVGSETLVLCLGEDGKTKWIFKSHIKQIRTIWERDGRPRMPTKDVIAQTIQPILDHQEWVGV
jgi:hypothetical protein